VAISLTNHSCARGAVIVTALAALLHGAPAASAARPQREPLVERAGAFLTAPSERRPAAVALDYVRAHPATFGLDGGDVNGLRLERAYRSGSGAVHLQWEQFHRGIPVFGAGLRANVDADGRLINVGGGAQPDPHVASIEPRLPAPAGERATLTILGDRLAWRVLVRADPTHVYDTVVDASTGDTLYRVNLVREAGAQAFDNYPGAPLGGVQVAKTFPETGDDPWLTESTRLFGDNAHVFADPSDDIDGFPPADPSPQPGDEIPPSAPGAWNYTQDHRTATSGQLCPPAGCTWNDFAAGFSWTVNRAQAATQLFYYVNTYHDHLRDAPGIGFDDSSNNFEGADRVEAQVDDGATTGSAQLPDCNHTNNAFVIPVPEGTPLVMQIYLWTSNCSPGPPLNDVNAADDALVIYHEYTHGMTNRLVTDAAGFPALNGPQPAAMDEGFADWYALDMLNGQGLELDTAAPGELVAGRYEHDALRTQPFDCPIGAPASACPGTGTAGSGGYTYGDFGRVVGTPEVHADGEIWVETLWDLRTRLIADHGAGEGIDRARALVTDGLRLAPANPSFLDMRNAIVQADLNRGFGDRDRIWAVFAARGMGYRASTTGNLDTTPVQDFSLPPGPLPAPPLADTAAPSITRLSISKRRIRVGGGLTFSFRISEPATATIAIDRAEAGRRVGRRCRPAKRSLRRKPRCTRYVRMGRLEKANLRAGTQQLRFSGRFRSRALRAGPYRATLTATDLAGNRSRAIRLTFRVVGR
jgi:extracellular elastinolytic metalloproteinase